MAECCTINILLVKGYVLHTEPEEWHEGNIKESINILKVWSPEAHFPSINTLGSGHKFNFASLEDVEPA